MWFSSPEAVCFKWLAWTLFCTDLLVSEFRFCYLKKQVLMFKTDFSCFITDAFHHLPLRDPLVGQKYGSSIQSILPNKIQGSFWQKVLEEKSWKSVSYQDWVSVYTTDRYLLQNLYYSGKVGISCLKKIVARTAPEEPDSYSRNFSRVQFSSELQVRVQPALHLCGFCVGLCFVKRKQSDHSGFKEHLDIASSKNV